MSAMAVTWSHNPMAAMAQGEKMFIQPAMVQILSRPKVIRKAAETTPVIVLCGGMIMWVSRVSQLRTSQPVPPEPHLETHDMAPPSTVYQQPDIPGYPPDSDSYTDVEPEPEPGMNGNDPDVQDNSEIVAALQTIRMN